MCLWDKEVIEVEEVRVEGFFVSLKCHFVEETSWMFTNVYGPVDYDRKEAFGRELEEIRGNITVS